LSRTNAPLTPKNNGPNWLGAIYPAHLDPLPQEWLLRIAVFHGNNQQTMPVYIKPCSASGSGHLCSRHARKHWLYPSRRPTSIGNKTLPTSNTGFLSMNLRFETMRPTSNSTNELVNEVSKTTSLQSPHPPPSSDFVPHWKRFLPTFYTNRPTHL
jgi:hypothetical protein